MYKAEILADSLSPEGNRLTTMKITFPRFILAEFNTHRMFSRNSASSRAIPFNKMVKMVEENPFIPIAWQKDHKGMQGSEYITDEKEISYLENHWLDAKDKAVSNAIILNSQGVTKQLCNRLLEPFMWHTVIVTSGEEGLENFFKLRCPQYKYYNDNTGNITYFKSKKDWIYEAENNTSRIREHNRRLENNPMVWYEMNKSQAEIHIQAIAELMWDAYNESTPKQLKAGEWHIPFSDKFDIVILEHMTSDFSKSWVRQHNTELIESLKLKIATARCARISYETLGDNPKIDYEADLKLHDTLAESEHWSPFEHVARAMNDEEYHSFYQSEYTGDMQKEHHKYGWCRNFRGFIQYRAIIDI